MKIVDRKAIKSIINPMIEKYTAMPNTSSPELFRKKLVIKAKKLCRAVVDSVNYLAQCRHPLILKVKSKKLTYLSYQRLNRLRKAIAKVKSNQIEGSLIEAGCALGGSSIVMGRCKENCRELIIYDVFEMIPAPSRNDSDDVIERYQNILSGNSDGIGGEKYYGYETDLYKKVKDTINLFGLDETKNNITLVKGNIVETLKPEGPVALAHVDVDWYDSVLICLERIFPLLSIGGCIIIDDFNDWSSCRNAVMDYLRDIPQDTYHLALGDVAVLTKKYSK